MRKRYVGWWLVVWICLPASLSASEEVPWNDIGVDEKLGSALPASLSLVDEDGVERRLGDYLGSEPSILTLVYYDCTTLCPEVLGGLARSLRGMNLEGGQDYRVLAISFDPSEGPEVARARKKEYAGGAAGWHFLTGNSDSVKQLTEAVGFRYVSDPSGKRFAHPAVVVVLTPEGVLSRYFYRLDVPPRDLKLALVEASAGKIGSTVDQILLYCYHYDPATGRYGLVITRVIRLAGIATIAAIALLIVVLSKIGRTGRPSRKTRLRRSEA
jgi:protein SCO1/2